MYAYSLMPIKSTQMLIAKTHVNRCNWTFMWWLESQLTWGRAEWLGHASPLRVHRDHGPVWIPFLRADNSPFTLFFQKHRHLCQTKDSSLVVAFPCRCSIAVPEFDQASVFRDSGALTDPQTSGHKCVIESHGAGPDPLLIWVALITLPQDHHTILCAQT